MVAWGLLNVFFPPPASVLVNAMSLASFAVLTNAGWLEAKGKHMRYSKLFNAGKIDEGRKLRVGSRIGMLVLYTPALLAGFSSFFLFPEANWRFALLRLAITAHFFKRDVEVLFVHKYSGSMDVQDMITISLSYFSCAAISIYNQLLTPQDAEPPLDLKYFGLLLVILGLTGNFYHHFLLSKLRRTKTDSRYRIPEGGLFPLVACPHYLFEILVFWGIAFIAQTVYPFGFALGTTFYLTGRSIATLKWYRSKFDEFPTTVKALIPYIL